MTLNDQQFPRDINLIIKPYSSNCDLECRYCYYLATRSLYPGKIQGMNNAVLEDFIRQYLALRQKGGHTFNWQGGEPTLAGLDFYHRALNYQEEYRGPGTIIHNTIQTNGMHIDHKWAAFFKDHHFLVGVSLDGPASVHDHYRVDRNGQGTFSRVRKSIEILRDYQVPCNILACLHTANIEYPLETYHFFRDELGVKYLQFIPIVQQPPPNQSGEIQVGACSVTGRQYGQFLVSIYDEWIQNDVGKMFIQIFENTLAGWSGLPPRLCVFHEVCGSSLVLEFNGDLYSCDHFVQTRNLLGNIQSSSLAVLSRSEKQRRFGEAKWETLPEGCLSCGYRFLCAGGCPKNRFPAEGSDGQAVNFLCDGYRAFFSHTEKTMRRMAEMIKQGRLASEIMNE